MCQSAHRPECLASITWKDHPRTHTLELRVEKQRVGAVVTLLGRMYMQILKWSAPVVVLALAGMACHKRPPAIAPATTPVVSPTVAPRPPSPEAPPAAAARPAEGPLSEEERFRRKSLDELNAEHPLAD